MSDERVNAKANELLGKLSDADIDEMFDRLDQTERRLQRRIIASFMLYRSVAADEIARLCAVINTPSAMVFADGREPTENERHLWNLLTWREADLAKQKEQTAYFQRLCDEAAAKLDRAEAERTARARLEAWLEADRRRDCKVDKFGVHLESATEDRSVRTWRAHHSGRPDGAHPDVPWIRYCGTPERPATLDECILAALELWDAQETEVPG